MPSIAVELPEQKASLDGALTKQFTQMQRQLLGLVTTQQRAAQTMRADFLTTLRRQQTDLTDALESLLKQMPKGRGQMSDHTDGLVQAIRELRQVIQQRPKMQGKMNGHGNGMMRPQVTVNPKVTVTM